jgi:putative flippase GtrA
MERCARSLARGREVAGHTGHTGALSRTSVRGFELQHSTSAPSERRPTRHQATTGPQDLAGRAGPGPRVDGGRSSLRSFFQFGLLSGGGWLLDCTLLLILSQAAGVDISVANVISSITAALAVFTVSRLHIFEPAARRPLVRTVAYALYTLCVIAAASALLRPLVGWLELAARHLALAPSSGEISFAAKVLVTPPQLIANFFMSRYLSQRTM